MIHINIDSLIKQKIDFIRLHTIRCNVKLSKDTEALWLEGQKRINDIKESMETPDIAELKANKYTRLAYKALGKDPSRYRPSAEALLRRILKDKGIYKISNVVDIISLVSVSSGYSIGGYDVKSIRGEVTLKPGGKDEPYETIGRGVINIENLPVLYDQEGPFGNPTSDSNRTSITSATTEILLVFFDFIPDEDFSDVKDDVINLLAQYAGGVNFLYNRIDG